MAEVVFRSIAKVYQPGNVKAVSDFSLTINDREFVVLVGPSGCGKSTALRMVAGLEEITQGDILIDGKSVNSVPPRNRDIAMVFQNYALYPHMSVYENLAFGLKLRKIGKKEIDARVRDAAEILGLADVLKRKPKALSGGQRQRVAVGRAIVRKPKVFLFDEPLSNLDAKMRVQMRAELCQLHARLQATMVYVTHDQIEAMTMGNRIVVMKDGCIQQVDEPMNIYNRPANVFVAGFIGTPPMNLFGGSVRDGAIAVHGHSLLLTPDDRAKVDRTGLTSVTVGIRPHDFRIAGRSGDALIETFVDLVEPLGAETLMHCRFGDAELIAVTDPHVPLHISDKVALTVRCERIKLFHPQTGVAL
jgi:multiple sugar transport system ATP-binding protein